MPQADPSRIAVLGFGFGGLCALDLARSGVSLKGAISVYGHFEPPPIQKPIRSKILILHGSEDPIATQGQLRHFEQELNAQKVAQSLRVGAPARVVGRVVTTKPVPLAFTVHAVAAATVWTRRELVSILNAPARYADI